MQDASPSLYFARLILQLNGLDVPGTGLGKNEERHFVGCYREPPAACGVVGGRVEKRLDCGCACSSPKASSRKKLKAKNNFFTTDLEFPGGAGGPSLVQAGCGLVQRYVPRAKARSHPWMDMLHCPTSRPTRSKTPTRTTPSEPHLELQQVRGSPSSQLLVIISARWRAFSSM